MANMEMSGRILDFLSCYLDAHGYSPTYREIASAVGLKSTSSVCYHVRYLRQAGKIEMKSSKERAVTLHRWVPVPQDKPQRLRIELADGGVLFVDCTIIRTGTDDLGVMLSGIMDASHLRGNVGSVVSCTVDNG